MVTPIVITTKWPPGRATERNAVDASFCDLVVKVNDVNVTSFQTDAGVQENSIEMPTYYLAEWLAENWWALLWEPCKTEEGGSDPEYLSRHWIPTAEHGFVLPSLYLVSTGDHIKITATERQAQYADARFVNRAEIVVKRDVVHSELSKFVESVVNRVQSFGKSPLMEAWTRIKETEPESYEFCQLIGALGLSPYEAHDAVERALDMASSILEKKQLFDLCLTSTAEDFVRSAYVAGLMQRALNNAKEMDLSALETLASPNDQVLAPAWRYGYQAARELRAGLSVAERDIEGASAVFEKLNIDPGSRQIAEFRGIESPISGGVESLERGGRMVLSQDGAPSRRFAASRATFFFWTGMKKDRRLLTDAVTRDQQASRAFAAELLVPQAYLRSKAEGSKLRWDQVYQIAERATASLEVVKHQASNCGLQLA